MDNNPKYGCVLIINTEDQHPEIVTTITGVRATSMEIKGQPRIDKKTGKERIGTQSRANLWNLDSGYFYGSEWDLEKSISKLLNIISSNPEFETVFSMFKKECFIRCYAYVEHYNIAFGLSSQVLYDMYKVNIPIEFDLYSLPKDT